MTFTNQTNRVSAVGSGSVGQIVPFSFPVNETTDLLVLQRITATGVESTLAETTNYTVVITGDTGGTVTTVTAIAVTAEIHIIRDTPNTQELDLVQGGDWNAENAEAAFDKNTKLTIENADALDRVIRFADTDPSDSLGAIPNSVDRASKFLTFDSDGNPTATTEKTTGTAVISAFGETLIDDTDAATAQATLLLKDGTADLRLNSLRITGWAEDVMNHGATRDGVTDDAAAFNAACTAARAAGGGYIIIPAGSYSIQSTVNISECFLVGVPHEDTDPGGSIILFAEGSDTCFEGISNRRCGIEDLTISKIAAFAWDTAQEVGSIAVHIRESAYSYVRRVSFSGIETGIFIDAAEASYNHQIVECEFRNVGTNIELNTLAGGSDIPPNGTRIYDCIMIGDVPAGGTAIKIVGTAAHSYQYAWIHNNRIENYTTVFDLKLVNSCRFIDNEIESITNLFAFDTDNATDAIACTYEAGGGALPASTKGFLPATLTAPSSVHHGRLYTAASGQSASIEVDNAFVCLDFDNTTKTTLMSQGDVDSLAQGLDSDYIMERYAAGSGGKLILDDLVEKARIEKNGNFVGFGYQLSEEFDQDPATTIISSWASKFWTLGGTNAAASDVTIQVSSRGGRVQMVTAGANDDSVFLIGPALNIRGAKNFKFEVMFQVTNIANVYIAVGVTEGSFVDKTTPDDDYIALTFDSDGDTNWTLRSNDNNAGTVSDDLGIAASTGEVTVRVDCTDAEQPRVWINATEIAAGSITGTIQDAGGQFTPYLMVQSLTGAADTMDVFYFKAWQDR